MERGTASFQGYTYKYKIYKFQSEHSAVQVQAQKTLLRAWGDGWRRGGGQGRRCSGRMGCRGWGGEGYCRAKRTVLTVAGEESSSYLCPLSHTPLKQPTPKTTNIHPLPPSHIPIPTPPPQPPSFPPTTPPFFFSRQVGGDSVRSWKQATPLQVKL